MSDPRYVVLVSIDEPKGIKESFGFATAGWVAAPAFGAMVNRVAALYGMLPLEDPNPPAKPKPAAAAVRPPAPATAVVEGGRNIAAN